MGLKDPKTAKQMANRAQDKIRPKWDWKEDYDFHEGCSGFKIKSDQNGIESCSVFVLLYLLLQWIKSDQNGIERAIPSSPSYNKYYG